MVVLAGVVALLAFGQGCNSLDFQHLRWFTTPKVVQTENEARVGRRVRVAGKLEDGERAHLAVAERSDYFVDSALREYYRGSYADALQQLDRAKLHNPHNYGAFRLSGQIHFELEQYYKAYDNWARAAQLPNDDRTMDRDLGVLKQVIRYSREQVVDLRNKVNREPRNRLAAAKLDELERKLSR